MLINEAIDAVYMRVASPDDIDLAMTKGVNYPKGLLAWANELGLDNVLGTTRNAARASTAKIDIARARCSDGWSRDQRRFFA